MINRLIGLFALTGLLVASVCWAENAAPVNGETAQPSQAEPAKAPPAAVKTALKVTLKIGTGVENRDVVGANTVFTNDTAQLWAWSLIEGAETPTEVKHVWLYGGKEIVSIPLKVTSPRFRTYTHVQVAERIGKWTIQVVDESGVTLASQEVEVKAEAAVAPAAPAAPAAPQAPVQK